MLLLPYVARLVFVIRDKQENIKSKRFLLGTLHKAYMTTFGNAFEKLSNYLLLNWAGKIRHMLVMAWGAKAQQRWS